jgi:DNA-binding beta-propeller fold protein YncE
MSKQGTKGRGGHGAGPKLSLLLPFLTALFLFLPACGTPPGQIFDPADTVNRWPTPPDQPRIAYLGQIRTDADLKPGRRAMQGLGEALFGKEPPRAMLKPMGVCTDGGSRLFVCDCDAQLVHVFDLSTRDYQQWKPPAKGARPFVQPVALAYGSGRLFVADSLDGSVFVFDSKGAFQGTIGDNWLHRPCGLAVDTPRERLLVVDSAAHQIVVLGLDGRRLARIGKRGGEPGEFNFPTNIAIDSRGQIYVSDSLNFRVQVLDADFKPLRQFGRKGDLPGYFSQPKGLAIDHDDHLYVVDANFEAVQLFDRDGAVLMSFGKEGHGPGEFWLPVGIHCDPSGRIWVADSFNKRVQVFERLAEQRGTDAK